MTHNDNSKPNHVFSGYGIELRPIKSSDLPVLRRWRNDPRISQQMADTSYISPHAQRKWYERVIANSNEAHWVVWYKGTRAGYMNLKGQGELCKQKSLDGGLYVGDSPVRHGLLGYSIALMQLTIVFEHLKVPKYETSYRQDNDSARRFNKQLGYTETGAENGFIKVSIFELDFLKTKKKFARYFKDKRSSN